MMKITAIVEKTVPIATRMRNAVIDFSQMTASAVAVITDVVRDGQSLVGYGFNSNGRYAQGDILRDRLIPRLLNAPTPALLDDHRDNIDPLKAWCAMMANEKPGGHGERSAAVGALDMALWDVVAKVEEKPLYQLIAERFNDRRVDESVYVYAAGGYYHLGGSMDHLVREVRDYLDAGYETVKIKVGGACLEDDLRRIEAVVELVGDGQHLAVDANARFDLDAAVCFAEAIEPYSLKWYEEPCDPLDFLTLGEVRAASTTPLATGENLFSLPDARNLIRYGGLHRERDFLQVDPALSYGLVEYLRILRMLDEHGWSRRRCIPHGGHQFALHIAAGLGLGGNESYPGVFAPFGGFGDGVVIREGRVVVPDAPGVGFELKSDLMDILRSLNTA